MTHNDNADAIATLTHLRDNPVAAMVHRDAAGRLLGILVRGGALLGDDLAIYQRLQGVVDALRKPL